MNGLMGGSRWSRLSVPASCASMTASSKGVKKPSTSHSKAPRSTSHASAAARDLGSTVPAKHRPALKVPCDPWSAYEWRFHLATAPGATRTGSIVSSQCQGNVIRREMYTVTRRAREFNICRRHQVEISSMKKVASTGAR